MQIVSALKMAKHIIGSDRYNIAVDATLGNGKDTILLSERSNKVYAFDVQKEAIDKCRSLLKDLNNVILINDGHENIAKYVNEKIDIVVFNLGYLPGGDKSIVTKSDTTLKCVEESMKLLDMGAKILITSYSAHLGGKEEQNELIDFINKVDQKLFNTFLFTHENGTNEPAKLIIIEKKMQFEK